MDYKEHDFDPYASPLPPPDRHASLTHYSGHIEPMWHSWISYAIDTPPPQDPLYGKPRSWAKPVHIPNLTFSRAAYKPYNTYVHQPGHPILLRTSADCLQSQGQDQGVGARCPAEIRVGVEETTSGPPATYLPMYICSRRGK